MHLFFGDILLLRINESPNFIALDAARFDVAHDSIVILSTGATHLLQETKDCDLGNARHSYDGIYGSTFNQSRYYSGALIGGELVHDQSSLYLLVHEANKNIEFFLGQVYACSMVDENQKEPFRLTSEAAKKLSRLGAAKGGEARAQKLSPERRREIARAAIEARWQKAGKAPLPQATHKGNFKEDFGIDVDCYVLNDESKTAVISQRGMGAALRLGEGGRSLPRFVAGKTVSEALGVELLEKLSNPLVFKGPPVVGGSIPPMGSVYGYDVTLLIDVCKALIKAESEGKLLKSQANIVRQAHIIIGASAKAGIKGLVYALAGYNATKEEVIAAFKLYVREEARDYEREFPEQLYEEWYRLYQIPRPEKNRPWKFKHLTVDQVYRPLAKSSGKILKLTREQRENSNARWKKLHQFLSEIGVKALRTHLGQLLGIAGISQTRQEYEGHFKKLFGEQLEMSFPDQGRA